MERAASLVKSAHDFELALADLETELMSSGLLLGEEVVITPVAEHILHPVTGEDEDSRNRMIRTMFPKKYF